MNEKILIGFKRDGKNVDVTGFDSDPENFGITLHGETSSFPRGFAISLTPVDPMTKSQCKLVRQRLDWPSQRRFTLNASRAGGRLLFEGVDAEALPPGTYNFELRLGGMSFKQYRWVNRRIPAGGSLELTFEEKKPELRFKLNRQVSEFDGELKRILGASTLDDTNASADKWIQPDVLHRDRRKACLMNILAKLAVVPSRQNPLSKFVDRVIFVEMDRIYAEVKPKFFEIVRDEFLPKDALIHGTHRRLLKKINCSETKYKLESRREKKGSGSFQIVGAVPKNGGDVQFVDIDIDGANPGYDLAHLFIHFGHLFHPGKTNHLKIRKRIVSQTSDFLYYDAVKV